MTDDEMKIEAVTAHINSLPRERRMKVMKLAKKIDLLLIGAGEPVGSDALAVLVTKWMPVMREQVEEERRRN